MEKITKLKIGTKFMHNGITYILSSYRFRIDCILGDIEVGELSYITTSGTEFNQNTLVTIVK